MGRIGSWLRANIGVYVVAVVIAALAIVVRTALVPVIGLASPYITFYLGIVAAAAMGGAGPGLLVTIVGAVGGSTLFAPESIGSVTAQVRLGVYLLSGIGISLIAAAMHRSRRRAEDREEWFRAAFEHAPVGVEHLDLEGRFLRGNSRLCEMLGYSEDELRQRTFAQITHPDDLASEMLLLAELLCGRTPSYSLEKRCIHKDGHSVWVYETSSLVHTPEPYRISLIEDISPLKQAISELKAAQEQMRAARDSAEAAKTEAERASRAKDHFLAVLSHELRTPLTPVVAMISMLQETADLDPPMRENLEFIRRNVELEAMLIDDLLDLTRIARGKVLLEKQPAELCKIIRRAVEVCRPDIEARGLRVEVSLEESCTVEADAARLQQVFWNILKNAIKFTPPGGRVGIRCRQQNDAAITEISDSGVGIEPEALSRIFNAFEQAERSMSQRFGGLGLGLTISSALVELHGGSIEARSEGKDKGATFTVKLPVVSCQLPEQKDADPSVAPGNSPLATRPLRILLVEDHGDTARIMSRLLRAEGHQVQTAADVSTALELSARNTFDLLISDLGLPDGSGLDLMRSLRDAGNMLPAIALSGYGQEQDIHQSRSAGFVSHLTKPVNLQQLHQTIRTVSNSS